ncbi:CPBP family intramembrane glutamic endopeptidase [Nocardiopsis sp. MG754419]|uniref:CPBP family intramembrane glutamic endopeptidase n=1 Tax=Nocardiopsis sp. MG754419 TaxID=2259865 RepID=UPI001BACC539|nr:CPBP family intramembrane glutamic endopeptidase [Nocardiopsis sp. MG754419]MBR8740826.1 CPBP family intramembrane metalloprotease [Nocardiopsis sp. MG754419]
MTSPSTTQTTASTGPRPGWIELTVGLAVMALIAFVLAPQLNHLGMSGPTAGIVSGVVSGGGGLLAFLAAALVRRCPWETFGVRRTTVRWMMIGLAAGLVAFVARAVTVYLVSLVIDVEGDTQASYAAGAGAGAVSLALMMLTLAVLTPLGEEFLFRGVVTTVLLRYGALVGVVGSAVVFALMHGINEVLPAAVIVGLIAAELYRRSGSIWPGVLMHALYNAISLALLALAAVAA